MTAAAYIVVLFAVALTNGADPTTQPTTTPATSPAIQFVPAARYSILKKDRDALAEQLALAVEEIARLHKKNEELQRALRASTRPANE